MREVYRLHSSRYPVTSGIGESTYGGRWNPTGIEVIYASDSPSLSLLEFLVHYDQLPDELVLTLILIPDRLTILVAPALVTGWDSPIGKAATQEFGRAWAASLSSAVLKVPSAVVPRDRN